MKERGSRYGNYMDLAVIAQTIKDACRANKNWLNLNPAQKESIDMIASKIARVVEGDPTYMDNWHDIQGYARLSETFTPAKGQKRNAD